MLPQVQAARVLEIPVIATEQYPKGLLIEVTTIIRLMFMPTALHLTG